VTKTEVMLTVKDYQRRRILGLLLGIILTGIGTYQFSNIWTIKSDLIKVKGTLASARTYISMVFTKGVHIPNEISVGQKSELIFHLNGCNQEYYLSENIGDNHIDEKYETILNGLKEADSVSVWIRKNEQNVWRPQVFQIDNDETTLLKFEHLHMGNDPITAVLFVIGVSLIILCSTVLLRDKFRSPSLTQV
jgi:hypothetical protein